MWVLRSFGHGLVNIPQFRGRDTLRQFWPYCLLAVAATHVAFIAAFVPVVETIVQQMAAYVRAHPDQGSITQTGGGYSVEINGFHPEVMALFKPVAFYPAALIIVVTVLLAAAIIRRLRDGGKSLWLGLLPLLLATIGIACLNRLFAQGFDPAIVFGAIVGCFGYLIALIVLIVALASPGAPSISTVIPTA